MGDRTETITREYEQIRKTCDCCGTDFPRYVLAVREVSWTSQQMSDSTRPDGSRYEPHTPRYLELCSSCADVLWGGVRREQAEIRDRRDRDAAITEARRGVGGRLPR